VATAAEKIRLNMTFFIKFIVDSREMMR